MFLGILVSLMFGMLLSICCVNVIMNYLLVVVLGYIFWFWWLGFRIWVEGVILMGLNIFFCW